MTVRLRLLLVWLMLAAVPLQGFAAASMLFCAAATHGVEVQSPQPVSAGPHDHFRHSHKGEPVAGKTQGADQLADGAHTCGVCASCCHSTAITEFPPIGALAAAPQAQLDDPLVAIHSRPAPVPEKPPRA